MTNHGIKKRAEFFYQSRIRGSPGQYSNRFVEWIVQQYERDREFFIKERNKAKARNSIPVSDVRRPWDKPIADVQTEAEETIAELVPLARSGRPTANGAK